MRKLSRVLVAVPLLVCMRLAPARAADQASPDPERAKAVAALVEQGHAARVAGHLDEAASLLVRARVTDPASLLPVRESCEVALAREEGGKLAGASRESCHRAMVMETRPEDFRNEVASLLSPSQKPTLDDLAAASLAADAALRAAPSDPWGYAARCDIARRLGNADVMAACLSDLQRVAPTHDLTAAELQRLEAQRSRWSMPFGALVFLLLGGTLVHAAANRTGRPSRRSVSAKSLIPLALLVLGVGLSGGRSAWAAADEDSIPEPGSDMSRITIDDANPEASVPSPEAQIKQPLQFGYFLQDLTARAEKASAAGNHAQAGLYYRALTKATTTAVAARQMCEELEAAGDHLGAVVACRTAITRPGTTPADFSRFVHVVLAQKGALPANEKAELDTQIDHLAAQITESRRNQPRGAGMPIDWTTTLVPTLRCEVALRFHDVPALEACSSSLAGVAPDDQKTISFQWALALEKDESAAAQELLDRARVLGMTGQNLARMEAETAVMRRKRFGRIGLLAAVAGLIVTFGLYGARRATLRRRATA